MRTAARGMAVVDAAERIYQTANELARGCHGAPPARIGWAKSKV